MEQGALQAEHVDDVEKATAKAYGCHGAAAPDADPLHVDAQNVQWRAVLENNASLDKVGLQIPHIPDEGLGRLLLPNKLVSMVCAIR